MFPFILSPHSRALQPLCSIALRHSRTSHASFCPHKGLLSFNLHFLSFMSSRCVIGFRAHRLAKAVCSQHRCKVLCDSCNVSQCNLVAKQGSSFTIHNMCKQNTCDMLQHYLHWLDQWVSSSDWRLTPAWTNTAWHFWYFYVSHQNYFPMLSPFAFLLVHKMSHICTKFKLLYDGSVSPRSWSCQRAGLQSCLNVLRACHGQFHGKYTGLHRKPKPFLPKPLKQHQPSILSSRDCCLLLSEMLSPSSDVMEVVFLRYRHD